MKEIKLPSEKKKRGKKFIAVIAVCMIAVFAAGYVAIEESLSYTEPIPQPNTNSSEQVGKTQEDVKEKVEQSSSGEEASESSVTEPTILIWPVANGKLMREYSADALVFSPTMDDWRTHNGIDISASVGSVVRAMASGTVKDVRKDEMLGTVVEIEHSGYTAFYCNMQETVSVKAGQEVLIGDTIGGVGNDARLEIADEAHLHLELKKDGKYIDPISMMNETDAE